MLRVIALALVTLAAACVPHHVTVYHPRPHLRVYGPPPVVFAPPRPTIVVTPPHVVIGPRWR